MNTEIKKSGTSTARNPMASDLDMLWQLASYPLEDCSDYLFIFVYILLAISHNHIFFNDFENDNSTKNFRLL